MSLGEKIVKNILDSLGWIIDNINAVESMATILAIGAGVWWFVIRRARIRRANISHNVSFADLGGNIVYVGVHATIKNIGNVRIKSKIKNASKNVVIIEELSPYLGIKQESQELSPEYKLKFLGGRTFPKIINIEPGESQTTLFDFIIQKKTKVIKVYSYIDTGYNKNIGWNKTTIHEVSL